MKSNILLAVTLFVIVTCFLGYLFLGHPSPDRVIIATLVTVVVIMYVGKLSLSE